jgi:hypothetical protein
LRINQLSEVHDDFASWGILREVFADLPLYENLQDRLAPIISQTNFVHLCERDMKSGMIITETASLQVINLHNEELRLYFKDQVIKIAQLFARRFGDVDRNSLSQKDSDDLDRISNFLIEFARNTALAVQPPQDVVEEFVDILTQLVETWKFMTRMCKSLVQTLIEELPIAQAQKFWPLLVRLRAM